MYIRTAHCQGRGTGRTHRLSGRALPAGPAPRLRSCSPAGQPVFQALSPMLPMQQGTGQLCHHQRVDIGRLVPGQDTAQHPAVRRSSELVLILLSSQAAEFTTRGILAGRHLFQILIRRTAYLLHGCTIPLCSRIVQTFCIDREIGRQNQLPVDGLGRIIILRHASRRFQKDATTSSRLPTPAW